MSMKITFRVIFSMILEGKFIVNLHCMYVLVCTPSLLRVLRVFQNQYKQISQNHPETPK